MLNKNACINNWFSCKSNQPSFVKMKSKYHHLVFSSSDMSSEDQNKAEAPGFLKKRLNPMAGSSSFVSGCIQHPWARVIHSLKSIGCFFCFFFVLFAWFFLSEHTKKPPQPNQNYKNGSHLQGIKSQRNVLGLWGGERWPQQCASPIPWSRAYR